MRLIDIYGWIILGLGIAWWVFVIVMVAWGTWEGRSPKTSDGTYWRART